MTDNIDAFPQHRAGRRKPTIADIVNDCVRTGQRPRAIRAIIRKLYPGMPRDDVKAAVTAEIDRQAAEIGRQKRELDSMKALYSVIAPIWKVPISAAFGGGKRRRHEVPALMPRGRGWRRLAAPEAAMPGSCGRHAPRGAHARRCR